MLDLVFVLATVVFFVVSLGYIAGCDRLVPRKRDGSHKSRSAAPGSQGATTEDIGHI
ncbi:MAG: hypothetical protein ABJA98_15125 [Acidobacteriota bacterium]